MIKALTILACLIALALTPFARADGADDAKVTAQIQAFYHWYVHTLNVNASDDPLTHHKSEMRKYVTEGLIRRIDKMAKGPDGLDGDYFLDAQDWDKEWEKNIAVAHIRVGKDGRTTAGVTLEGKEMGKRRLEVELTLDGGVYKIDKVKAVD